MNDRIIFHVDVNNAFLSWSAVHLLQKGYKQDIRKIPAIIGGDEKARHGIVLAKSPPAKKFGIVTAETLYSARRKCPNLKIFPGEYEWYYYMSNKFHKYLRQYSPCVVKYSVDEAYIDLTGTSLIYKDYLALAYKIKNEIKTKFGFTVNVGIGNNMLCAKMASDFEKPDKVHTLFMNEVKTKMWPLPIEDLFMVGKKTSAQLRNMGIDTIGDLANTSLDRLKRVFKNQAEFLKNSANGIDFSKVERQTAKNESISISETMPYDVMDIEKLEDITFRQTDEVTRQLRSKKYYCKTVAVFFKNHNFESYSKQTKLENPSSDTALIYNKVKELINSAWKNDPIRLIGVRLTDFTTTKEEQLNLFTETVEENKDEVQEIIDQINNKYGSNSVIPASMKKS